MHSNYALKTEGSSHLAMRMQNTLAPARSCPSVASDLRLSDIRDILVCDCVFHHSYISYFAFHQLLVTVSTYKQLERLTLRVSQRVPPPFSGTVVATWFQTGEFTDKSKAGRPTSRPWEFCFCGMLQHIFLQTPMLLEGPALNSNADGCRPLRLWRLIYDLRKIKQKLRLYLRFNGNKLVRLPMCSGFLDKVVVLRAVEVPDDLAWYTQYRHCMLARRLLDQLHRQWQQAQTSSETKTAKLGFQEQLRKLQRIVDKRLWSQEKYLLSLREIDSQLVDALLFIPEPFEPFPFEKFPSLKTFSLYISPSTPQGVAMRQVVGACSDADNILLTGLGHVRDAPGRMARVEKRHNSDMDGMLFLVLVLVSTLILIIF
jgi:hypothetical protein